MDFKVAGTGQGITALQMDIKIAGVTREIMGRALEQARAGRLHILEHMERTIGQPRSDISTHAPRLHSLHIPKEKIRDVIGPGGKTIRSITEETGCQIEIEDDGRVIIASPDRLAASRALEMIERLTEVPEIGKVYTGQVRRVEAYGAFVEIMPGTDGLVHISELSPQRIENIEDVLAEGDEITVKVIDIDSSGKVRLSKRALEETEEESRERLAAAGSGRGDRGGDRGRGGGRGDRGDRGRRGGRPPGRDR
jgi:polyribonucleotide nucleotidyltransferase